MDGRNHNTNGDNPGRDPWSTSRRNEGESLPAGYEPRRPIRSFIEVIWAVIRRPAAFFERLAASGRGESDEGRAVWFIVAIAILSGAVGVLYSVAALSLGFTPPGAGAGGADTGGAASGGAGGSAGAVVAGVFFGILLGVPLACVFAIAVAYLYAAVMHLALMAAAGITGSPRAGFGSTLRATIYGSVPGILSVVPVVGLLAGIWVWVLMFLGLRRLHGATTAASAAAVGVVAVLGLVLFVSTGALAGWRLVLGL